MTNTNTNTNSSFIVDIEHTQMGSLANVTLCKCYYDVDFFDDQLFSFFNIDLPNKIQQSVTKRRAEYLAGRYAAQQALLMLGFENRQIKSSIHRCPIWPNNVLGSITHVTDIALCATALNNSVYFLGIDIEAYIGIETIEAIKYSIIDTNEECLLLQLPLPFPKAFSLVFSAKESLFKALYPKVGRYFDFSSVRINSICLDKNTFCFSLQEQLSTEYKVGHQINGHFGFTDNHVITLVTKIHSNKNIAL